MRDGGQTIVHNIGKYLRKLTFVGLNISASSPVICSVGGYVRTSTNIMKESSGKNLN